MASLVIAAPGDPATPTGGYRYDARVLAELRSRGHMANALILPEDFPFPSQASIDATFENLAAVPAETTLVVDGLAYGALPAERIAALGRPVVALVHHPLALETGLTPEQAIRLDASERAALAAAALVVTPSAATKAMLIEGYGVPKEKIRIAEPGVDPAQRARGGEGAPVLLTVAAVTPRKNQIALARALGLLTDLDWRWRLVGSLVRDRPYVDALRSEIAALGLSDRVELAGEVDDRALSDAFDRADLFVLPSKLEGYGMAYAEALAHALPVVAGRCEASAAIVPEKGGALVDPDDVESLAAELRRLVGDGDARERASRHARAAGARLPRWFQCADVFEHIMETSGAARPA